MRLKHFISLALILVLTVGSLVTTGCGETDAKVRRNIVLAVTGVRQITQALSLQLPPDNPKYLAVVKVRDAADRFLSSFDTAKTTDEKVNLVPLLADLVSGFSASVLPLTDMGGWFALTIVGADTALRFVATYFRDKIIAYEKLLKKQERELAAKYKKQFEEFLATPTAKEVIAWQSLNLRQPLTSE